MADSYIKALISYALDKGMIEEYDKIYCTNALMNLLKKDSLDDSCEEANGELNEILDALCDYAAKNGIIEDSITYRYDLCKQSGYCNDNGQLFTCTG